VVLFGIGVLFRKRLTALLERLAAGGEAQPGK
jgi:hypothetical protein